MKLIIYGLGQIYQRYKDYIPMKQVEAFVDKNAEEGKKLFGIPVITPQRLSCFEFDYIVVFSDKFFFQIQRELCYEHSIPKEKIVSWRIIVKEKTFNPKEVRDYLIDHIKANKNNSIIEFGLDMMYGAISPVYGILRGDVKIDGAGKAIFPYVEAFYDHIWEDWTKSAKNYDLAVVKPGMITASLVEELKSRHIPTIIVIEEYDFDRIKETYSLLETHFPQRAKKTILPGAIVIEIIEFGETDLDCKDYVITHKKYKIEQDELYQGLCVGKYRGEGMLSEQDGESVAEYNDRINETSGLYWIWKNTTSEYVGLSHYRRFFYNNTFQYDVNRLNKRKIKEILADKKYDIILSVLTHLDWTVYENINRTVGDHYNSTAYRLFLDAIKNKQPDYVAAFENVMSNKRMYICNMFVTSRKILDEYCSWLFSFFLDVVDQIDVSEGTVYQKRVTGYYSEAFWTVWMLMQSYKVYELPVTNVWIDNK